MTNAASDAVVKLMIGINIGLTSTLVGVLWWVYRTRLRSLMNDIREQLTNHGRDISTHRRFLLSHAIFLQGLKRQHEKNHPGAGLNGLLDPNELLEVKKG